MSNQFSDIRQIIESIDVLNMDVEGKQMALVGFHAGAMKENFLLVKIKLLETTNIDLREQ